MSDENMKQALSFLKAGNFSAKKGFCEVKKHTDSNVDVFMLDGLAHCGECYDKALKQKSHQEWLQFRKANLHQAAHLPKRYEGQRFMAATDDQKAVRMTVKAFVDAVGQKDGWCALILYGGVGTGKTLMASELAEAVIDKFDLSVRYCTAKQMISEIQASYSTEGKSEEGEILRFVQYGLLILDEIDIKSDSKNAALLLQEVINRRYNEEKPVVVITNQTFDNLSQHVGDRIDSRLHENAFVAAFTWEDFRKNQSSN